MVDRRKYIRVFIADDHHVFRLGLAQLIAGFRNFKVAGEAADGKAALKGIKQCEPDIAVLDISMPGLNGLEVCRAIQKANLRTAVIILSMHKDINYLGEALEAGAKGYILKSAAMDDLAAAFKAVADGKPYITTVLMEMLLEQRRRQKRHLDNFPMIKNLTETELKVLKLIAKRMTSKAIAKEMSISYRTVQKHRANICAKLNLSGWNALAQFAAQNAAGF